MEHLNIARNARQRVFDADDADAHDTDRQFTPADFFKEAGAIIAVCLGLGVLMQILLG
jgi:hypothetical protein